MRAHRFPLALLALLAFALFLPPLLRGEVFTFRDHFDYFQPLRWFTAEELKGGRLPLWNPYSASGEPWLANPQTGVFYPPTLLFLVLPFPAAYMLFLLGHLVLLGCGAYLLFARTASRGAAMVGAVAVMFCGPTLSLLDINNNLATIAWLPLVLWCAAERAWRRGAVVLAMSFLAGEPFFAGVAAVMFAIVAARPRTIALAGAGAFGLSAIQLFPFLEVLNGSDRAAGMSESLILRESMPPGDWLRVAMPPAFTSGAFDPNLGQHFIPVIYTGMLVVALAVIGLTVIRKRHVWGWLALLLFAIAVGSGPELLARLPLTLFRYPARLVPLGALAIAGLAVAGWDRIRADKRWLDLLLVLLVVADLLPRVQPLLRAGAWDPRAVPYPKAIGSDLQLVRVGAIDASRRASWIAGYLNLYDRRFDTHTAAPFASERYLRAHYALLETPTAERLAFFSAGYVLASMEMPRGLTPIARAGDVTVYRTSFAWPMARLVSNDLAVRASSWEVTTTSARIVIDTPKQGMVVLAQQLAPGWSVTVDGEPRPPVLHDGVFRAVEVMKGRHEVVWSYRPRALFAGAAVTLVTIIALVVKRSR